MSSFIRKILEVLKERWINHFFKTLYRTLYGSEVDIKILEYFTDTTQQLKFRVHFFFFF